MTEQQGSSSTVNVSGGVNANTQGDSSIQGDVVGRDKIVNISVQATYTEEGGDSDKNSQSAHAKIERLMPVLLEEMRDDLLNNPTAREFVILKRSWGYNSPGPYLAYYLDDHEDLGGKLQVLGNLGFVRDITYNNVRRFLFQEEFVDYLTEI